MNSKVSNWAEGIIEVGWLFALIATPLFFNIQSDRIFEPDKITLLRSIVLVMSAAWIVRWVDQAGWQTLGSWDPRRADSMWRQPLVLPVILLVLIYAISTAFSVTPFVSWAGSYQRLQGTFTTFSYIVIFALLLSVMRTRAQVDRLITIVIVTSIPVALYGVLQHELRDPLPWGGDTSQRVAGHMGNAIFIGAYLIMAIPLTIARIIDSFRNILTDADLNYADVAQASIYMFALPVQILTLAWSGSRGPWLGLMAGVFAMLLILVVSLRNIAPNRFRPIDALWPLLMLVVAFAGLLISARLFAGGAALPSFLTFIGVLGALFVAILILLAIDQVWHWLWFGFLLLSLFVAGWIGAWNLLPENPTAAGPVGDVVDMLDGWRELPGFGRMGLLLEDDSGTGKVRVLIWQGALELIAPHEPITFPDGSSDRFNFMRTLIGYGPESMYVAYNSFYPPELATLEARNASPDRSHNETFDALVITGVLGFSIWQLLYLSVFYYGFTWLGVVRDRRDRILLVAFFVGGAAVGLIVLTRLLGNEYLGVAIPFGSLFGLVLYLIYHAIFGRATTDTDRAQAFDWRRLMTIGLLAAILAHYVEIHFGIAIASTRTHFFAYIALLVIIGSRLTAEEAVVEAAPAQTRRRGRGRARTNRGDSTWLGPSLAAGLILAFVVGILTYEYINFQPRPGEMENLQSIADLPTTGEIVQRAYLVNTKDSAFPDSPFVYGLIVLSWLLGLTLIFSDLYRRQAFGPPRAWIPLTANRRLLVVGYTALNGVGALVAGGLSIDNLSLNVVWGSFLALVWGASALAAAVALQLGDNPVSRNLVGGVATVAVLAAVPMMLAGTAFMGVVVGVSGAVILGLAWADPWNRLYGPIVVMGLVSFSLAAIIGLLQASLLRGMFIPPATVTAATPLVERRYLEGIRVANFLSAFYVYAFAVFLLAGVALGARRAAAARDMGSRPALIAAAPLLILALVLVNVMNVRVIHADMIYKRGKPFDQQGTALANRGDLVNSAEQWDVAIRLYEHAIDLVPREDFYYLWLGRAYLEKTNVADAAEQQRLLTTAEARLLDAQSINPLNTDHTANLARLNVRWAGLQPNNRASRVETAADFYRSALQLSPQNSIIRNELAGLYATLGEDCERALTIYDESAAIDPFFADTYYAQADTYVRCGLAQADEQTRQDYFDAAEQSLEDALDNVLVRNQRQANALDGRVASIMLSLAAQYQGIGDVDDARDVAARALELAAENADLAAQIQQFIAGLDAGTP